MTTALAGLLGGYYWVWSRSRFVRLIDALPGPNPLPLLGNILHLANFSLDGIKTIVSVSLNLNIGRNHVYARDEICC